MVTGALAVLDLDKRIHEMFMSRMAAFVDNPEARIAIGNALINSVISNLPRIQHPDQLEQGRLVKTRGFVELGALVTPDQVADLHAYFSRKICYNNEMYHQSDRIGRRIGDGAEAFRLAGYHINDVIRAPHLLEIANHPSVIGVVEEFLGCVPTITLMSSWWSFPETARAEEFGQQFHRDFDDFKFCALFFYLSDVDEGSGPHQYIESSASLVRMKDMLEESRRALDVFPADLRDGIRDLDTDSLFGEHGVGRDAIYEMLFKDHIRTIQGPAGSVFLTNTYGLHRGRRPRQRQRLLAVVRYGLSRNVNDTHLTRQDFMPIDDPVQLARIPDDARSRYINRLLLKAE